MERIPLSPHGTTCCKAATEPRHLIPKARLITWPFFSLCPVSSQHTILQLKFHSSLLSPDPVTYWIAVLCISLQDLHHGRIQMKSLTNKWYEEVRQGPSGSEDDEQELF